MLNILTHRNLFLHPCLLVDDSFFFPRLNVDRALLDQAIGRAHGPVDGPTLDVDVLFAQINLLVSTM